MSSISAPRQDPTEGLDRAVEAGRELASDALRLARLELVSTAQRLGGGLALLVASALLFAGAWGIGVVALALYLARVLDPPVAVSALALLHLVVALGCVAWARSRLRPPERSS